MKKSIKWFVGILILWIATDTYAAAQPTASSGNNAAAVIIVVDESASVLETREAPLRLRLAAHIIDELADNDLLNVVRFADSAKLVFPSWTLVAGQRESLKRVLSAPIFVGANTRIIGALQAAFEQLQTLTTLKRRLMVFLISDGRFALDKATEALLLKFKHTEVPIYTVSVISGNPVRLQTLAAMTGGAYLAKLDRAELQRILRGTGPGNVPFPWAEIKSRLKIELIGPTRLIEGETVLLHAAIKLNEDRISSARKVNTAWGTATVTVRRVALLVDGQPTGDMSLVSGSYQFRLPSLSVGPHRVQAAASFLLQSGDAEHAVELPSQEQLLMVEALPRVQTEPSGQPSWLLWGSGGLALLLGSLVLWRVRRGKRAWQIGQEFSFTQDLVRIGSSAESDLVIPDDRVSEVHLSIQRDGNGGFKVKDESGSGVAVNGRGVRWAELHDADRIEFGPYTLEFLTKNDSFTLKVISIAATKGGVL